MSFSSVFQLLCMLYHLYVMIQVTGRKNSSDVSLWYSVLNFCNFSMFSYELGINMNTPLLIFALFHSYMTVI